MLRMAATDDERLAWLFRVAATRRPTDRELELLVELYRGQRERFGRDPAAAAKYLRTGDRPPPADLDAAELAAAAATANAVLNLDAAVMVR